MTLPPLGHLLNTFGARVRADTQAALDELGVTTREVGVLRRLRQDVVETQKQLAQLQRTDRTTTGEQVAP